MIAPSLLTFASSLLFTSALARLVSSQNVNPSPFNEQFDPYLDDPQKISRGRTSDCSLPPEQDPDDFIKPREGLCANDAVTLTDAQIQSLAEDYAPALFFHPLEEFTPETPGVIFKDPSRGKVYNDAEDEIVLIEDTLNLTRMLLISTPNPANAGSFFFEYNIPTDEYKGGAGFEFSSRQNGKRIGHSRANLYYNVFDSGFGTLVFNYFIFYSWNGAATFGVGVGNRQHSIVELDPIGSHEGDWETVSVLTCASAASSEPLAVSYRQHSHSQITDCTHGECTFFQDTNHPVGFVALGTHATYPKSSRNIPYIALPIFPGFFFLAVYIALPFIFPGFFFLADQTVYRNEDTGEVRLFLPNATNIQRLTDFDYIRAGPLENYWQGFGGRWGDSRETAEPEPPTTRCMNLEQSHYVECPKTPPVQAMTQFLSSTVTEVLACLVPGIAGFLQQSDGPTGPIVKTFFAEWVAPQSAAVWDCAVPVIDEATFCKWLGEPIEGQTDFSGVALGVGAFFRGTAVVSNIIGFIGGIFG